MSDIKEIENFANKFEMSQTFIRRMKTLYMRMAAGSELKGLSQTEYKEYRDKCERFTNNIISKLTDKNQ